jgi:hypothetical protein
VLSTEYPPLFLELNQATFERFSTFLHWIVENKSGSKNIDHYLDDFLFGGEKGTNECTNLMLQFENKCSDIGVPIANEKSEWNTNVTTFVFKLQH